MIISKLKNVLGWSILAFVLYYIYGRVQAIPTSIDSMIEALKQICITFLAGN